MTIITEKEIEDVVVGKLTRLGISSIPCWVDKTKTEGINLTKGDIISFWIKEGEKVFGQPASDSMQAIINSIKFQEKSAITQPEQPKSIPTSSQDAILPETFTPNIFEKWGKMKTVDRMMMFQHTPFEKVKEREGAKGKTIKYVEGNYMLREANAAFLFAWGFEIKQIEIGEKAVAVIGRIQVEIDGKTISRDCVGYEDTNQYMNTQLAIKSAAMDCMKKGLSLFGFNNDVYSGEV